MQASFTAAATGSHPVVPVVTRANDGDANVFRVKRKAAVADDDRSSSSARIKFPDEVATAGQKLLPAEAAAEERGKKGDS